MAETPRIASLIARAIVHLNFNEPEEAKTALFEALTDFNFNVARTKENSDGNRSAA